MLYSIYSNLSMIVDPAIRHNSERETIIEFRLYVKLSSLLLNLNNELGVET